MELFTTAPVLQSSLMESSISALQPTPLLQDSPLQDSPLLRFQGAAANLGEPLSEIQLVSANSSGNPGNSASFNPRISADGRFVVFESFADNLVAGDTNQIDDIFLYDTQTHSIRRISVDGNGNQSNGSSFSSSISADGRFVVFQSDASNLVAGDTNNRDDIFLYDTQTDLPSNRVRRISVDGNGNQGNGYSFSPVISADGRFVTFSSTASDLVEDDTNNVTDVFLYDTQSDTQSSRIRRISVDGNGNQSKISSFVNSISGDGRFVTFQSSANNLVAGDTNYSTDIFLYDTQANSPSNRIRRISVDSNGNQANNASYNSSLSADGRFVVFESFADNLVAGDTNQVDDVFLYDTQTSSIRRISIDENGNQGNGRSLSSSVSADGRFVAFQSDANNLVAGDSNNAADIFLYDTQRSSIQRVSADTNGNQGDSRSLRPNLSADGRFVAFSSAASNLVGNDLNGTIDIFVRKLLPSVSVSPIVVAEGNSGITMATSTATLSQPTTTPVIIPYSTADGTATSGNDYVASSGNLVFQPGQTTVSFSIPILGDRTIEPHETFMVNLTNPTNARLLVNQVVAQILNDDIPNLSINNVTQVEGTSVGTSFEFTVSLDTPSLESVAVTYYTSNGTALAGSDYAATNGNLWFNPGETSKTVRVTVVGDAVLEADETFFVNLASPINAAIAVARGMGTILNDDAPPITLLEGTNGNDTLTGDNFANTINGKAGNDSLNGNGGEDTINGGAGNDFINGGDGNDIINGGSENDTLFGGNGNDVINGGSQDDVIYGNAGADTLIGGTGSDRFVYTSLSETDDTITDFGTGADILDLSDLFRTLNYIGTNPIANGYLRLVKVGGNTQVQFDAKNGAGFITLVTLNGVAAEQLVIGQNVLI